MMQWLIELRHRRACFSLSFMVQHCFMLHAFVLVVGWGVGNLQAVCTLLNFLFGILSFLCFSMRMEGCSAQVMENAMTYTAAF